LNELGRHGEAVASYERAIAIQPDYVSVWYLRGVHLPAVMILRRELMRLYLAAFRGSISIRIDYM